MSDIKDKEGVWFWNESANEINSDSDYHERSDEEEWDGEPRKLDGKSEESRTEKETVIETHMGIIKWNKNGENNLQGGYGKGSQATTGRKKKVVKDLEKKASKTYNIKALWQCNQDRGLILRENT